MILNNNQISKLLQLINNQHISFIGKNIGIDYLSIQELDILRRSGIDITQWNNGKTLTTSSYQWGMLSIAIGHERASKMNYNQFEKFVASSNFLPLTKQQIYAKQLFERQLSLDVRNQSHKIQSQVNEIITQSAKSNLNNSLKFEQDLRELTSHAIIDKQSIIQLSSALKEKTKDWNRDMDRIADYAAHTAYDYGRATQLIEQYGQDVEVYKQVYEGACKHCIKLYTTSGIGSEPIVFKLTQLIDNGTNIGKKVIDWSPVVGATHPFCRCQISHKQKDWVFDKQSGIFEPPKDWVRKVQRKSSFTIN